MRRAALATGFCLVLALAACRAPAPAEDTPVALAPFPTATAQPTPAPINVEAGVPAPVPSSVPRPSSSPTPANLPLSLLAGHSGSDLRVALDRVLQENAFLIAQAMQASNRARLDELIGVSAMLDENALAFAETVATVQGQPAAQALVDAWRAQTADLIAYAQGQSSDAADLDRQRATIATQAATGNLPESTVDAVLQHRGQQELALADAIAAHDTGQTVQRLTDLQASSDELGGPLAAAMAAQISALSPAETEGADVNLRLHLDADIVARVYWTGAAVDAAADSRSADARAFSSAADQVADQTGSELAAVYGADVGNGVADRLRSQTAVFVAAASGGDRHQAASDIERLRSEIDRLLSGANPLIAPGLLTHLLRGTDQPLLSGADAFIARDYNTAYARLHESAKAAQKPADTLALAIVDRYPGRYLNLPPPSPSTSSRARGPSGRRG